jgi:transcriptional regulator NrdR family protein
MLCPHCNSTDTRVTNTYRTAQSIRRRHSCADCKRGFYTFQVYERDLTLKKINKLNSRRQPAR